MRLIFMIWLGLMGCLLTVLLEEDTVSIMLMSALMSETFGKEGVFSKHKRRDVGFCVSAQIRGPP